ncbi:MAG: hypothetical protein HQK57_11365 [Deltaproteobacteria bacterium]|nr:hypothetical protein [Deltaproteobacteria bacterium]MBF0526647.1 hypothetical protein [Deltaproteobacteria bacterium]
MTLAEEIQKSVIQLPVEKQIEALDFIIFLQQRVNEARPVTHRSLKNHAAFGSWKNRHIDAVLYQQTMRAEWDE